MIVQARYGSSRLPGKVLKCLNNKKVLDHIRERTAYSKYVDDFIIATTTNAEDDSIHDWCVNNTIKVYRGSENNVLDRFYQAAFLNSAEIVVMCTADCPMLDPYVMDDMIRIFIKEDYNHYAHKYYGTNHGFPDGFDINIIKFEILQKEWAKQRKSKNCIEHACGHLLAAYGNGSYPLVLKKKYSFDLSKLHLSLDTPADLKRLDYIFKHIKTNNTIFTIHDVLDFLSENTEVLLDNNEGTFKGQELYKRAKKIIPGGTQLLSKRPEMFLPNHWPAYYQKAHGIELTTLDGVKMKDFSYMGIGSCILGYKDEDVNRAVHSAIDRGNMATLNCPNEVKLTELLLKIHPWAHMARYARTGGESVAVAIRIARASSKKDKIAFCGYHGWHDWYLSANWNHGEALKDHLLTGLSPIGVPKNLKNTAFPFNYNRLDELNVILETHDIGTIIMEPQRSDLPKNDFLKKIREICTKKGIILIFDEISSGFRLNSGGLHLKLGITPDVAVFAKAISNGYCMGAIIGKRHIMTAAEDTFISSTYWTEDIGFTAAIATITKHIQNDVGGHINSLGKYFQTELGKIAKRTNIQLTISGLPCFSTFTFDYSNSMAIKTLYIQEMLKRNILAKNVLYLSYAHKQTDIDFYLENIEEVFLLLKTLIDNNKIEELLKGPIAHSGFKRLS